MDYIWSFLNSSSPKSNEDEKYLVVDSNSLIWDLNHLSLNDLEDKYNCNFNKLSKLLKESGCKVFSSEKQPHKIIKIPPRKIF